MNIDQWMQLLDALIRLVQALSWPLVVVLAIVSFGVPIKRFLSDLSEGTLRVGAAGFEASGKRRSEATAALAIAESKNPSGKEGSTEVDVENIVDTVDQALEPASLRRLVDAWVLWVDDHPLNNSHEMRALKASGIRVTTSESTEDALEKLRSHRNKYSVVISDMVRGQDREAGLRLLEAQAKQGDRTPFIFYTGSIDPGEEMKARERGAWGVTNRPQELYRLVIGAINRA